VLGARGAVASLAPLLGFGTARTPEPAALVEQADALFRAIALGADARALLSNSRVMLERRASERDAAAAASSGSASESLDGAQPRARRETSFVSNPAAPERRSALGALWAAHVERADAFAWITPGDDNDGELHALCEWAARFEAARGRPPLLWVRELCADISLEPVELLAHVAVYMTRCDLLLLIASPATPHSLYAVVVCHMWRTLGDGSNGRVEVVLASAEDPEQTVAALDQFHVMHADAGATANALHSQATQREWAAVAERLQALRAARDLARAQRGDARPAARRARSGGQARPARARGRKAAAVGHRARDGPSRHGRRRLPRLHNGCARAGAAAVTYALRCSSSSSSSSMVRPPGASHLRLAAASL
jgi:hypothetical protein